MHHAYTCTIMPRKGWATIIPGMEYGAALIAFSGWVLLCGENGGRQWGSGGRCPYDQQIFA